MEFLRNQRSEMSSQLISARERRTTLAKQYEEASGANRAGLERQLNVLDQRIVQLETDIAESGRAMTAPEVGTLGTSTTAESPWRPNRGQVTGMSIVFTLFVLAPLAIAAARMMWRKASRPVVPPGWADATHRFERLEQAVDAVAIEMERVSEGQRFMTRIMTERTGGAAANDAAGGPEAVSGQPEPLALGPGSPEQVFVPKSEQEAQRVRRS